MVITPATSMKNPVERLAYWIDERERIRRNKEQFMQRPPWTLDPILGAYRFCNIHREDDKVTRWIAMEWRDMHTDDPNLWHAMLVARYLNWPDTLEEIGYPEAWPMKRRKVSFVLRARKERGDKVFTGAYIVSTNGATMDKVSFVCKLFDLAWKHRHLFDRQMDLAEMHAALMQINGVGSFMAAQIIADLKYSEYLMTPTDWGEWAAPGPGSLRGLSRVRGLGTGSKWRKEAFVPELVSLRSELRQYTREDLLDLQDLQNCLCEFDKYERVRLGQGKPRSGYTPQ